ncbi:hypothetical protein CYMTET_37181 [Cymbomonas tetramitiformis]|uniref:Thaumatin-like protein n=1 Tax=Cymbomonas tetramitiformis TaxID=36881 RepID=A0AAE0CEI2_9CHLO|nr:hypothetical protein CYMTET_37181 [Cymbomonas tetramitiformis]
MTSSSGTNASWHRAVICFALSAAIVSLPLCILLVEKEHSSLGAVPDGTSRITVHNKCDFEIWVGTHGTGADGTAYSPGDGGFRLEPKFSTVLHVSKPWISGRIWGRTGCKENAQELTCETGDCNGQKQCKVSGEPPCTLVEMTLGAPNHGSKDIYDLSLVDGYNLPVEVVADNGINVEGTLPEYNCQKAKCANFDMSQCPPELTVLGSGGLTYCGSICFAASHKDRVLQAGPIGAYDDNMIDNVCCHCACGPRCGCDNPNSKHCCSPLAENPNGGVCRVSDWPNSTQGKAYPDIFESQCPDAYSWQFDDVKSLYRCLNASYQINFCP